MDKFTKKLNQVSKTPIEVQEFQSEGSDVKDSFLKMVKSGVKCDGLVFSGHHTGSFGGKRGNGQLDISFMEELSCKDEYKDFFQEVTPADQSQLSSITAKVQPKQLSLGR